jgi:hypothetical protein
MIMPVRTLLIIAPILSVLAGCSSPDPQMPPNKAVASGPQRTADTVSRSERALPSRYVLTDTTDWGNPLEEGTRAILRRGVTSIDTVDLGFGVAAVGQDSLVFLPVRTDTVALMTDTGPSYESSRTDHVLWTPVRRRELSDFLPFFDADRSSPTISRNSVIYYWGIARRKPANRLYAMRYEFRTARLDSLFLNREDALETDYRYHLGLPQIDGNKISFDGVILDDPTWRVIRQEPPPN